jgi:hypothetical protein
VGSAETTIDNLERLKPALPGRPANGHCRARRGQRLGSD